jgi:sialate O-acetylesterase
MQFSLHGALNASAEIADAANRPLIRLFTVGQGGGMSDSAPLRDFTSIEQNWTVASPAAVGNDDFTYFSALCYLFGRTTQEALAADGSPTMPMGLISSNWGGTCLSSWTPADGTAARDCGMSGTSGHANLYDGLISPLVQGPMAVDGFLFSQGECDADCNNTAYYACAFPRFIEDWRGKFGKKPDEGFFSFQLLPAYVNDSGRFNPFSLPYERQSQLRGLAAGGPVHVANTIDLGDALAPYGSVHPRNKQEVARRMSVAAQALLYGDATVPYLAPTYSSASASTNAAGDVTVTITFAPVPPSSGALSLRPAACPAGVGGLPASECSWFEIMTADGAWHNATGVALTADATRLVLTAPGVGAGAEAAATRAFFSPWPVVVLYGADSNLPALPWWEPVQL